MIKRFFLSTLVVGLATSIIANEAQPLVSFVPSAATFELSESALLFDLSEKAAVHTVTHLFAKDLERVTGKKPAINPASPNESTVIIGTVGESRLIQQLVSEGKLDVSKIENQWEQFIIKRIKNPLPGIKQGLVIVGSDRRGTAYGLLTISEAIGVNPWYWWADVPVEKKADIYITQDFVSRAPSVKYRGIFINDEDWGLLPWAANNSEKELGDIGPKTYAKVCELLLRLKANMMAPAMHTCTGAFYSHPQSKVIADQYGIIMTTSHCEPLLFNNAAPSEWDKEIDGEWNYGTNKTTIWNKLNDRVQETSQYENIYTVGMRGLHDEGMRGDYSEQRKVELLEEVMKDQRDILTSHLDRSVEEIPQIFVPYKETLNLYNLGLEVSEDVTLVWTDDNFGYLKRLSNPEEQQRSGGAGVYYHFSYLGPPHDYLWLNTTPPVLFYSELMKAYENGADRYWLVNVGDIKPAELGMQTFFELAWNVEAFDAESINTHQAEFLSKIYGEKHKSTFQYILDTYYRLAWSRKPEYMGWERQWDPDDTLEQLADSEFSFEHYNDAQQRLTDYANIASLSEQIASTLPTSQQPSFFEMLGYPVQASHQMNRKFLLAQLNHELSAKGQFAEANWAAQQSTEAQKIIDELNLQYNSLLDGKWQGMMMVPPGLVAKYQNMPDLNKFDGVDPIPVNLEPEANKNQLDACIIADLEAFEFISENQIHSISLLEGIGYDWKAIQLGKAEEPTQDPSQLNGPRVEYDFAGVDQKSVTVHVTTIPFFPLHTGVSNQFGISLNGADPVIFQNEPTEFSKNWKDQVLENGVTATATFQTSGNPQDTHTLTLTLGDPGIMIQKVIIDWGGLKKTYVGTSIVNK